jgi:hypothetical protein
MCQIILICLFCHARFNALPVLPFVLLLGSDLGSGPRSALEILIRIDKQ